MKKTIVTTSWDDGHALDRKLTDVLKQFSLKGTLYISPKDREFSANDLLSDNEVALLAQDFEIGAHTMTHPRLSTVSAVTAGEEILHSKQYLEKVISASVTSFCYPGGDYTATNINQVKEAPFVLGRTVKRFSFDVGSDPYQLPTTLHAYRHWSDIWHIAKFTKFNPITFLKCYLNWDVLGMKMFDYTVEHGGVFHLWGHSWEIEKNKDWQRLENLCKYISNRPDVSYVTNRELYE